MISYAELQVTTNFSFLRGASHPHEYVERAAELGLSALAVTDRNSLAGVVRAHVAAKSVGLPLVVGCRLDVQDAPSLLVYPRSRKGYGALSRMLTHGKRQAAKGECLLTFQDVEAYEDDWELAILPPETLSCGFADELMQIVSRLKTRPRLVASHAYRGEDRARLEQLDELAQFCGLRLMATNDVHYHRSERRDLQDVVTCIRHGVKITEAGFLLHQNAERHLKPSHEMLRLFRGYEQAVAETMELVSACSFSLDELRYEYPTEPIPPGMTAQSYLEQLAWKGADWRYPDRVPDRVVAALRHELSLVEELEIAQYFLTVHDIVRFARDDRGILCQGRGSAANSAVCYCLGITSVDPDDIDLLFERFVSRERREPPDIDVDFEHERREEVIQYIYERYGRDRAGIAATVISYRSRSAIREVGKVMGLSEDVTGALAGTVWGRSSDAMADRRIREAGLDPDDAYLKRVIELTEDLIGFPRHLSQHVGGFVLTEGPLSETVPIGNAAMEDRTFVEWDKDDLEALGLMKVDVLSLGMLSCIRRSFELLQSHYGREETLASLKPTDPAVYEMLCRADSIGVFQVESRAQMNMLPRLKPREFYDLVIEVAIVRPGPIQGDMVHPYLRRRDGLEPVDYPAPHPDHGPRDELERILKKTLGVPLFQEQAMKIAIDAAKFTPDEANQLRHAMATFRRRGTIHTLEHKLISRMVERGYERDFAERCFNQIQGFGEYGFPESHSASFSILVYVSSWIKCHYPDVFCVGILNAQPMGFYAPAQLVRDARDHGVEVRPADVNRSDWDTILEADGRGGWAVRLGLRLVDGFQAEHAATVLAFRHRDYEDLKDLKDRSGLPVSALERLASADAFRSMGLDRRQALWQVKAERNTRPLPLFAHAEARDTGAEAPVSLPDMPLSEHVVTDYQTTRLSLKAHPLSFFREELDRKRFRKASDVPLMRNGNRMAYAGVVLVRQRPGSAKGVVFLTLEDETGTVNCVAWPQTLERFRNVIMASKLIYVTGRLQKHDEIAHLMIEHAADWTARLLELADGEGAPALPLAHADEVVKPGPDPYAWRGKTPAPRHPRAVRIIPKSRDFH
ncbi:error-prone DNA polymerase [Coralliovum pocilloporae]|uniref:error-prone DNA polymerase n=1 Tax=Coralliovum pocilloporae TaxID=3066369 RepID=UPI003306A79C